MIDLVEYVVIGKIIDTGALNAFETDQDITTLSTLSILLEPTVKAFLLEEVLYYMNPTNVETYQLYLLEGPIADDVEAVSKIVFDSGTLKADSAHYVNLPGGGKLPRIVSLDEAGKLYYNVDWTGPPGNTPGYIIVKGIELKRIYDP